MSTIDKMSPTNCVPNLHIIILAAGKGTRMKSHLPKVLHEISNQSFLERSLKVSLSLNPEKIILVVGHGEQQVREHLEHLKGKYQNLEKLLFVVRQAEQKGTGNACQVAMESLPSLKSIDVPVIIIPGDAPLIETSILSKLLTNVTNNFSEDKQASKESNYLNFLTTKLSSPFGYGRVLRGSNNQIIKIVEEKDASSEQKKIEEINTSFYSANSKFLIEAVSNLKPNNKQKELYLTDIVEFAASSGVKVQAILEENSQALLGVNDRYELARASTLNQATINKRWQLEGVTIENPESVIIGEEVLLSSDVYIGQNTKILGTSQIAAGVIIEGNSYISNSQIREGSTIKMFSYIDGATINKNCSIGPFVQIRPGSKLEEDVKVGNFVEIKKSTLGKHTKANHLSYLGDVTIGENVNIGAGTITANYDGVNKSQTIIEDGASTGSNSVLVAPVRVKKNAYIAAGSVITDEVPENALAVGRAKQKNIENWNEKRVSKSKVN